MLVLYVLSCRAVPDQLRRNIVWDMLYLLIIVLSNWPVPQQLLLDFGRHMLHLSEILPYWSVHHRMRRNVAWDVHHLLVLPCRPVREWLHRLDDCEQ